MLSNYINDLIVEKLGYVPTKSQELAIPQLAQFVSSQDHNEIFILQGYAGTGKTTLINALVGFLDQQKRKYALLAPTGRAAKVINSYTGKAAFTIHKKIYRQKSSKDGFGVFALDVNLHSNTIFIVDESSMIANESMESSVFGSGRLLDDLIEYVYNNKGCKLILVGDKAQLPPVGLDISPALNPKFIELYGKKLYQTFLSDVVRQTSESGILSNATKIREEISEKAKEIKLSLNKFPDIHYIKGEDLIECISSSYDKYGMEETVILTRSNKRANQYNNGIRSQILWMDERISRGDLLMVVKNNYYWNMNVEGLDFIANGDIAEIVRIIGYEERYGFEFANVELRFLDYNIPEFECKIMLDTLDLASASLDKEKHKEFFFNVLEDYSELKTKKQRFEKVKNDPYFNALQVKFSYAVTCHKAQGGQWRSVFIDHGWFKEEHVDVEFQRWMYTAITRSSEQLYLVNFSKRLLEEGTDTDSW